MIPTLRSMRKSRKGGRGKRRHVIAARVLLLRNPPVQPPPILTCDLKHDQTRKQAGIRE